MTSNEKSPITSSTGNAIHGEIDFPAIREALMGEKKKPRDNILIPRTVGAEVIKTNNEKMIERIFESCPFKTMFSGIAGLGVGGAIGLFSASVGPDLSIGQPEKQTFKQVFKEMKAKTVSHAKSFGMLGAMFAATECAIESVS